MRMIHTSDWHLGQRLLFNERFEEHRLALDWLLETIIRTGADLLVVAGDVFDIANPPNSARRQYYRFLTRLLNTACRHVVIIGGNHDSPAMLEAPRDLLESLQVRVIGAAAEDPAGEIIELKDDQGNLEAVVAAVPFLRDRDLRSGESLDSGLDRTERIREGIYRHYQRVGELMQPYQDQAVPLIATGHLYASGAEASARQDNIYIGNIENIEAGQFPSCFDYIALGHIHRPQPVGGMDHVRYSGSLIPLSFSETADVKGIYCVDFSGGKLEAVEFLEAPVFRRLKTITAAPDALAAKLTAFGEKKERLLPSWVEVQVETEELAPAQDLEWYEIAKQYGFEILKLRLLRRAAAGADDDPEVELEEVETLEVFRRKCREFGVPEADQPELDNTFLELMDWMAEYEDQ